MLPPDSLHVLRREVRATYPVSFLVGSFLVAGILALGLAVFCDRATLSWACFGTGIALLVTATGITLFGIIRRPEMLKSERTRFAEQALQIVGNDDISRATGERVIQITGHYLDRSSVSMEGSSSRKIAAPDGGSEKGYGNA